MEVTFRFSVRPTAPSPSPSRKFNKPPAENEDLRFMFQGRGYPLEGPFVCLERGSAGTLRKLKEVSI